MEAMFKRTDDLMYFNACLVSNFDSYELHDYCISVEEVHLIFMK